MTRLLRRLFYVVEEEADVFDDVEKQNDIAVAADDALASGASGEEFEDVRALYVSALEEARALPDEPIAIYEAKTLFIEAFTHLTESYEQRLRGIETQDEAFRADQVYDKGHAVLCAAWAKVNRWRDPWPTQKGADWHALYDVDCQHRETQLTINELDRSSHEDASAGRGEAARAKLLKSVALNREQASRFRALALENDKIAACRDEFVKGNEAQALARGCYADSVIAEDETTSNALIEEGNRFDRQADNAFREANKRMRKLAKRGG